MKIELFLFPVFGIGALSRSGGSFSQCHVIAANPRSRMDELDRHAGQHW